MKHRSASQAAGGVQQRDEAALSASTSANTSDNHPLHRSPRMGPEPKTPPTLSRRRRRPSTNGAIDDDVPAPPLADESHDQQADEDHKGHTTPFGGKTLDRLETWFGLNAEPPPLTLPRSATSSSAALSGSSGQPSSRLVLQHAVAPGDTLEALALRYGLTSRTLRQANGLWPGDSVQMRKFVYIPLDACTRRDSATTDTDAIVTAAHRQEAMPRQPQGPDQPPPLTARSLERKLTPQHGLPAHRPTMQRINSSASVTSSSAASTSASAALAPKVRRVPSQALSHFPPRSRNKGKARIASQRGLGDRVGASSAEEDEEGEPGESGVDDLLRLAEKARTIGATSPAAASLVQANREEALAWGGEQEVLHEPQESEALGGRGALLNGTSAPRRDSANSSSDAAAEEWKPNKWTFGGGTSSRSTRPSTTTLARSSAEDERGPAMLPGPASSASSKYNGWNDAPEPSLAAHVRGRVSHAYETTGASARRGRAKRPIVPSVLDDLAAGLPPNPGPASHWARPIGDSVPRRTSTTKLFPAATSATASAPTTTSSGWAGLLSDTLRGRMRIEEALQKGFEEVAASFEPAPPPHAALASATLARRQIAARQGAAPERPSAELARATLGRKAGVSVREERSGEAEDESESRPLTHELERIAVPSSSSTAARPSSLGPTLLPATSLDTSAGAHGRAATVGVTRGAATRRAGVRNIDWTAAVSESS